jgi:hypothetical protein
VHARRVLAEGRTAIAHSGVIFASRIT